MERITTQPIWAHINEESHDALSHMHMQPSYLQQKRYNQISISQHAFEQWQGHKLNHINFNQFGSRHTLQPLTVSTPHSNFYQLPPLHEYNKTRGTTESNSKNNSMLYPNNNNIIPNINNSICPKRHEYVATDPWGTPQQHVEMLRYPPQQYLLLNGSNYHGDTGGGYSPSFASSQYVFNCHFCGKSFKRKSWLKRHLLAHSADRQYSCPWCLSKHKRKDNLLQHMKLKHTEDVLRELKKLQKSSVEDAADEKVMGGGKDNIKTMVYSGQLKKEDVKRVLNLLIEGQARGKQ